MKMKFLLLLLSLSLLSTSIVVTKKQEIVLSDSTIGVWSMGNKDKNESFFLRWTERNEELKANSTNLLNKQKEYFPPKWEIEKQIRDAIIQHENWKRDQERNNNSNQTFSEIYSNNTLWQRPPRKHCSWIKENVPIIWIISAAFFLLVLYLIVSCYNKYMLTRQTLFYRNWITLNQPVIVSVVHEEIQIDGNDTARSIREASVEMVNKTDIINDIQINQTVVPSVKDEIEWNKQWEVGLSDESTVKKIIEESNINSKDNISSDIVISNVNTDGNQRWYEPFKNV